MVDHGHDKTRGGTPSRSVPRGTCGGAKRHPGRLSGHRRATIIRKGDAPDTSMGDWIIDEA